jgi:SAM-dependent methyltransferase
VSSCPLCGAAGASWATTRDVEYETSTDRFEYHRCPACSTIYLPDPPVDRLAEIYPSTYYSYADTRSPIVRVKEALDRRFFRTITSRLGGERLRVLDVGGGAGAVASLIRSVEPRVGETVVVDLDAVSEPAATAAGHRFVTSRIEDFTSSEPFDLVLLLNLIEHVADPAAVLRRVRDLVAPGGVVVVKTPNVDSLDARLLRRRSWGGYHAPRHWVLVDPDGFRRLAEGAGFDVDRLELTQGGPFWAVGVLATLIDRRLLRRQAGTPLVRHWAYGPLAAGFAAFDLVRRPFGGRTSQMFVVLSRAGG